MKGDEYKGYYCLLIAILCDLNAAEASTMYEYGPDHPLPENTEKESSETVHKKAQGNRTGSGYESSS